MPTGNVLASSEYCTSFLAFQNDLVAKTAVSIEISAGSTKRQCNDAHVANQIVAAFSTCTPQSTELGFSCQGTTWHVGGCGLSAEISAGNVGDICDCGNHRDVAIRPCINNNNWGGNSTYGTCGANSMKLRIDVLLTGN